MKKTKIWLFLVAVIGPLSACNEDNSDPVGSGFDRQAMLSNYAQNIIQPAYDDLASTLAELKIAVEQVAQTPNEANLQTARDLWTLAYSQWQSANAFNFGPAGAAGTQRGLIEEIGTFPASTEKIEAAIDAGDHSLNNFDRDARGFLALEYLLFGQNQTTAEVVAGLEAAAARRAHLEALAANIRSRVDEVVSGWSSYATTFTENDGTDVGSSTSQFYNEFVKSFESIKNFKVGLPAGKRPGQTQSEPQLVEAFYSGKSLSMIKAHFSAIEAIYYGRSATNGDGIGFQEYLESVEGGPELIELTEAQLEVIKTVLDDVPTDTAFSELVAQQHPSVDALHTELQRHTRFFKSDMSSLLGIAITFNSGDGD